MPSWPLPNVKFLMSGYQETMQNTVIRTEMDAGPAKVRQRFTKNVQPIKGKLTPILDDEYATLYGFFQSTCGGGALPFTWDMVSQRLCAIYPSLVIDVGLGIVRLTLRFTAPPTATVLRGPNATTQGLLSVDLQLEVMP